MDYLRKLPYPSQYKHLKGHMYEEPYMPLECLGAYGKKKKEKLMAIQQLWIEANRAPGFTIKPIY